jgi:hypothetical protein
MSKKGREDWNKEQVAEIILITDDKVEIGKESKKSAVKSIESDKGTVRKVTQYTEYYSIITSGIQGVRGLQPHLLFYDRTAHLDRAFADGKIKVFAEMVSATIGGMK